MELTDDAQFRRAIVEDEVVELLLRHYKDFVMHGGTAIWRCYGGNRFSRDVDFYTNLLPSAESKFQKEMHKVLIENGYPIREEKYNNSTETLHIIFRGEGTTGKLDLTFKKVKGIAVEYLKVDGTKRIILALSPEKLLLEKIEAYSDKYKSGMHEIQDLYDMVVLKNKIKKPSKTTLNSLAVFLKKIENKAPADEHRLQQLILNGIAPSFVEMLSMLKRWINDAAR